MSKQSRARKSSPNRLLYQPGLSPKYSEPKLQRQQNEEFLNSIDAEIRKTEDSIRQMNDRYS
jgi:hypothetical protein